MCRLALLVLILSSGGCEKVISVVEPISTANDAKQINDLYVETIKNPNKLIETIGQIESVYMAKPADYKDVAKLSAKLHGENDTYVKVLPEPVNAIPARFYSISFSKLNQRQCKFLLKQEIVEAFYMIRVNSVSPVSSGAEPLRALCVEGVNTITFVKR